MRSGRAACGRPLRVSGRSVVGGCAVNVVDGCYLDRVETYGVHARTDLFQGREHRFVECGCGWWGSDGDRAYDALLAGEEGGGDVVTNHRALSRWCDPSELHGVAE